MRNEILLIVNLAVVYSMTLLFYRMCGKKGLLCWNIIATIAANIEVMILVKAFGLEQTLGNILFASTFLTTDILSENYSKKDATMAVKTGIMASLAFIVISRFWLWFIPSENDVISASIVTVFENTPRVMFAGFLVYAIVQSFDVWFYHKLWDVTSKKSGNKKSFLWLRNNLATMTSQLINAILFNVIAFWGIYDTKTLINIIISTYVIYFITSVADTPAVYLARKIKKIDT